MEPSEGEASLVVASEVIPRPFAPAGRIDMFLTGEPEEAMLKQYALLRMCEIELDKAKMPPILRLKIDMQIMQAKCILLDSGVKAKVRGNACSEKSFTDLYNQVARSSNTRGEIQEADEILLNLHHINEGLEMSLLGATA